MEKERAIRIWDAIFGKDNEWAIDCFGTAMFRDDYGDVDITRVVPNGGSAKYHTGWEIDHIRPKSDFNRDSDADFLNNYEPMHWMNNREKADKYPHFIIDDKQYRVVRCTICHMNGFNGYGIIDETGDRIDWKGKMEKYFPTNK